MQQWIHRWLTCAVPVSAVSLAIAALLCLPSALSAPQALPPSYYPDNSDWWSGLNGPDSDESIKIQERALPSANFRVLGIHLSEKVFDEATAKLGKTPLLERGDASTGRTQACYVSKNSPKVFLIFEQGEVEFTLYLFSDLRTWNGIDRCALSPLVSYELGTAAGLHLGQSPAQVIAILGKPSVQHSDELIYSLHLKKKNSAADLANARKNNPHMSDADLHANYDFYDLNESVDVKFRSSKLVYLSISQSETT